MQQLREQIKTLEAQKADLDLQNIEASLSFPEARDRLLANIKEANGLILQTDKRIKEVKKMNDAYEKQLREMAAEFEEKRNEDQDKQKYEILYQRDKEMTDFIQTFDQTRGKDMDDCRVIQNHIIEMLEAASKTLALTRTLPSKETVNQQVNDLEFGQGKLDDAETTYQRLQRDYEEKMSMIARVDQLEEKVLSETESLAQKGVQMKEEITTKFSKTHEMKAQREKYRESLIRDKDELARMIGKIKEEAQKKSYDFELKKQKLSMHEQYQRYSELEKRYAQNEQQINYMKNFILTKTADMNYQPMIQECQTLINDMNKLLVK
jgi:intraflagellar transport protein 74